MPFSFILLFYFQGNNETLVWLYAASMCTLDKLSYRYGYENFDEYDAAYLRLNRARRYRGMCRGLNRFKNQCKQRGLRRIRNAKKSITSGFFSPLFAKVSASSSCPKNVI